MRPEGWTIVVVIALAIVLFGAPKLPGLARSVGQSLRIFKSEVRQLKDENNPDFAGEDYTLSEPAHQPHQSSNPAARNRPDPRIDGGIQDGFSPPAR